jgi:hypothetical protein
MANLVAARGTQVLWVNSWSLPGWWRRSPRDNNGPPPPLGSLVALRIANRRSNRNGWLREGWSRAKSERSEHRWSWWDEDYKRVKREILSVEFTSIAIASISVCNSAFECCSIDCTSMTAHWFAWSLFYLKLAQFLLNLFWPSSKCIITD